MEWKRYVGQEGAYWVAKQNGITYCVKTALGGFFDKYIEGVKQASFAGDAPRTARQAKIELERMAAGDAEQALRQKRDDRDNQQRERHFQEERQRLALAEFDDLGLPTSEIPGSVRRLVAAVYNLKQEASEKGVPVIGHLAEVFAALTAFEKKWGE